MTKRDRTELEAEDLETVTGGGFWQCARETSVMGAVGLAVGGVGGLISGSKSMAAIGGLFAAGLTLFKSPSCFGPGEATRGWDRGSDY